MEQNEAKTWDWETASGSALARCLIELLDRKDVITIPEIMGVLDERLSMAGTTKGETPEPVVDLREPLRFALQSNMELTQRLAAVEYVLTVLLACQSEAAQFMVRDAAAKSLDGGLAASDESGKAIRAVVDDIIGRALAAKR